MDIEVLVFKASEQLFGVRTSQVVEVLRAATLAPLPHQPPAVEGVLSLRGVLVPVIAVPLLLDSNARPMQHSDHLIVVRSADQTLALRVDRAIDLVVVRRDQESPLENDSGLGDDWIDLVAKTTRGIVHVLNADRLLSQEEFLQLVRLLSTRAASQEVSS